MLPYQLTHLQHFSQGERDLAGRLIDWNQYNFLTMQELDRLRSLIGSRCVLIRGAHPTKPTAIDAVWPDAPFEKVVMALLRSGLSKGLYQGKSIHLDQQMRSDGLARVWLAFHADQQDRLFGLGYKVCYDYSADGWDYYGVDRLGGFGLLTELVQLNG